MIHDSAMQRIVHDGAPRLDPLQFPGMAERTVTVGAAPKEYRLIGWRVGWVVAPLPAAEAIGRVAISNVVCPVGIAQPAVAEAIECADDGIAACTAVWQSRHDAAVDVLRGVCEPVPARGGWSMLIDMRPFGLTGAEASRRLLAEGVAATSMENWGEADAAAYLRLVIANEPVERLRGLLRRPFERALRG